MNYWTNLKLSGIPKPNTEPNENYELGIASEGFVKLKNRVAGLDKKWSLAYEHIFWKLCGLPLGLWIKVDGQLLKQVLNAKDFKALRLCVGVLR